MCFKDRLEAAARLAEALDGYRGRHALLLAVPRGAVPMGRLLADRLDGEMDVVLAHKLGAPGNPEFAIGAVNEDGELWLSPAAERLGIPETYVLQEKERQLRALRERRVRYGTPGWASRAEGRIVIVVDDGIATGATLVAALRAVRRRRPARLIAAAGVASPEAIELLRPEADELAVLEVPELFLSVGEFFESFPQVTDEEVVEALRPGKAAAP